jgi:hypothetical protein
VTPVSDNADARSNPRTKYEPPKIVIMDEQEVLKAFQVTSAGVSWWVM